MGLHISSKDEKTTLFQAPYSFFTTFRKEIVCAIDKLQLKSKNSLLSPLVNHSDCDGQWSVKGCIRVLKLLQTALPNVEDGECKEATKQMIKGLKYCIKHNQIAIFH
jgi:hypothetical protein